jgi:transposase
VHASEQDRPDVVQKRAEFCARLKNIDIAKLIFLDEAGAHTSMTRIYGRAPAGQRVVDSVPQDHWQITTMVSAIRCTQIAASLVFDGATDAMAFDTYVEQVLVPTLQPGDVVVMDNLSSHKIESILAKIRATGAEVLHLPPYSPDLNPIEKVWSKVKAYLRKVGARTRETLWNALADALATVTASDLQGYFASCGLTATPIPKPL